MAAFAFKSLAAVTAFVVQPSLALDNGLALTREYAPARTEGRTAVPLVPGDDG
jgi:hypothetical protein